ncbi:MAG: cell division protein ZapE [Alphaproteobacteria bacterium]|nr:cell division protein ZapE [Alphaproteobacteria bacterium]
MSTLLPSLPSAYQARVDGGEIRYDAAQAEAASALQNFLEKLKDYRPPGLFARLTKSGPLGDIGGFYLYGDVGRGKTMLMDMFFAAAPIAQKRRVHFHQFMLEIHARLHELQQDHVNDILPGVARALAKETWLLCFDEFHVSNIADAMILGRLFAALFEAGVIIVATSNWAPDELYKNGLQRDRFFPFIDLIEAKMVIHRLQGSLDHRFEQIRALPAYFHPLGSEATRQLQGIFFRLTDEAEPESITLPVQGRTLRIMHAAKGAGFFNFEELCGQPMGAADYIAIARQLHTVLIDNVPKMQADRRDETLRFMTLIDALYEAHAKLFMACAVPVEKLGPSGEHAFAFQRTVSRLAEMRGEEYRKKPHLG